MSNKVVRIMVRFIGIVTSGDEVNDLIGIIRPIIQHNKSYNIMSLCIVFTRSS